MSKLTDDSTFEDAARQYQDNILASHHDKANARLVNEAADWLVKNKPKYSAATDSQLNLVNYVRMRSAVDRYIDRTEAAEAE